MNYCLDYSRKKAKLLSCVRLFVTPWTVAYQVPPPMGCSRHTYWSLPFPSPGDHPDPGIEPGPPALQAGTLPSEPPGTIVGAPEIHAEWINEWTMLYTKGFTPLEGNILMGSISLLIQWDF